MKGNAAMSMKMNVVEATQQQQPKNPDVVEMLQTELVWLVVDKIG